jgi:hypothetical protein
MDALWYNSCWVGFGTSVDNDEVNEGDVNEDVNESDEFRNFPFSFFERIEADSN